MANQLARWLLVVGVGLGVACQRFSRPNTANSVEEAQAADVAVQTAPTAPELAYVTAALAVRHEAHDARHRSREEGAPKRSNWMTQLQRGEQVELLGEERGWAQIRTSDERLGFVRRDGLLLGNNIEPATLHRPQRMFRRPDLLALGPQPPLDPGSLVFVVRRKEQFCELNYAAQSTAWLLCAQLDTDPGEVDAAKLISRASALDRAQEPGGEDLRALARSQWGHTRLVRELLGELLPADTTDKLMSTPTDGPQAQGTADGPGTESPNDMWTPGQDAAGIAGPALEPPLEADR